MKEVRWIEKVTRGLAKANMENFASVADAIFELVDNAIDARRGKKVSVHVEVNAKRDRVVVEDHGGYGMDAEGIADWLNWGTGRKHSSADIGMYYQGGKSACGFLGNSLRIYAKAAGSRDVWMFEDDKWRERNEAKDWGKPSPLPDDFKLPSTLTRNPQDGYVRIEITRLLPLRHNTETLTWKLSNTYRCLLEEGSVSITLSDGSHPSPIQPLELPLSTALRKRQEPVVTQSGRKIRCWVARLNRERALEVSGKHRIPGGIRCLFNGRLIREGEYFGHHAEGKGLLSSLVGEVQLNHLKPVPNKTEFTDSIEKDEAWNAMRNFLAPIIAELRRASEELKPTKEERRNLTNVREEIAEVFRGLQSGETWDGEHAPSAAKSGSTPVEPPEIGSGGRKPPEPRRNGKISDPITHQEKPREPVINRSEPPSDAVGGLLRSLRKVGGEDLVPPTELNSLEDASVRVDWKHEGGKKKLIINRNFPLYKQLEGAPGYIAETIILELAKPDEGDPKSLEQYLDMVNNLLVAWSKVHEARSQK